jgi:large subunit ribosomal protein L21
MKYSIIQFLGKQYIIQPGFWYDLPYLKSSNLNDFIFINKILLLNINNYIQIGYPFLKNIFIIGKIIKKKVKNKKIIILKTKPKKNYTKKKGYNSIFTRIKFDLLNNI